MTEQFFKTDAKQLIDTLFETKCFREDITRDSMNGMEDFVAFCMQSRFDTYVKVKALTDKIKKRND